MRNHPLLATLGALALACSLAACADDPDPIIETGTSPSANPTSDPPPSPTPVATPTPDEPESAKAFIRRWQDANVQMQRTGRTSRFRALGLRCRSCDQIADRVDEVYGSGGAIDIGESELFDLKLVGKSGATRVFEFRTRSSPIAITDKSGDVVQQFTGGLESFQINVQLTSKQWRATRLTRLNA